MKQLVERKGADLFRFEKSGDVLRGVLLEIEPCDSNGRPNLKYSVHDTSDNRLWEFFGTTELNKKLRPRDIGREIEVCFEGMSSNADPKKHPIKKFLVRGEGD